MSIKIDSKFTNFAEILQSNTEQVFSTMLGTEIEPGDVHPTEAPVFPDTGIIAMVGIAGAVSGSVCIHVSNELSCCFASRLLMTDYTEVNADVLDAIAEISNMVVGGLKTNLEDRYGLMGLSLPTVISSERYISRSPAMSDRFTLTFYCPHDGIRERFTIHMSLVSEKPNSNYLRELAELHSKLA